MITKVKEKIRDIKKQRELGKAKKEYIRERQSIMNGVHSELMIDRPDGKDRCSLIITSYDTPQLKELQKRLEERGIGSDLLEGFKGGKTAFKFDLTPRDGTYGEIETDFLDKMKFLERNFVYGKPVKDIEFFTVEEKKLRCNMR